MEKHSSSFSPAILVGDVGKHDEKAAIDWEEYHGGRK